MKTGDKMFNIEKQIDEKIAKAKKDLEKTNKRIKKSKTREEETVLWALSIRLDEKIKLLEELREDIVEVIK